MGICTSHVQIPRIGLLTAEQFLAGQPPIWNISMRRRFPLATVSAERFSE
jgi:hypothetical protein